MGESITKTATRKVNHFVGSVMKTTNTMAEKAQDYLSTVPQDSYTPSGKSPAPLLNGKQAAELRVSWADTSPKSDPYFSYKKKNYSDLRSSRDYWSSKSQSVKSPTAANRQINSDYDTINKDMQRYLAGDPKSGQRLPHIADWTSYGKYASREAGEFIRTTENILSTTKNIDKASLRTTEGIVRHDLSWESVKKGMGGLANGVFSPIDSANFALHWRRDLSTLNKALVAGNTGIHNNIAPAYDAFLKGESDGGKGMESLKKAGYYKGSSKDRQGFVTQAFTNYQNARELGIKAQHSKDPKAKKALEAERQKLMDRGNLLLGYQEQMEILQKPDVFEQPSIGRLLGLFEGTMNVTDEHGKYDFLPNGGNWTDFATRMGLKEVPAGTPGADPIRNTAGQTTYYVPAENRQGTIIDYFESRSNGMAARNLNLGHPRELEPLNFTGIMLGDR